MKQSSKITEKERKAIKDRLDELQEEIQEEWNLLAKELDEKTKPKPKTKPKNCTKKDVLRKLGFSKPSNWATVIDQFITGVNKSKKGNYSIVIEKLGINLFYMLEMMNMKHTNGIIADLLSL